MRLYTDEAIEGFVGYTPGPGWLYGFWGGRWLGAIGHVANALVQGAKDATLSGAPATCSESSLGYHVLERGFPRFLSDTAPALRARLQQAPWVDMGTFGGLTSQLKLAGVTAQIQRYGSYGDANYSPVHYQIVVTGAQITSAWGRVGDPGARVGDGRPLSGNDDLRARVERTCARVQAAQSQLKRATVVLRGTTIGNGSTIGGIGLTVGGEALVWDFEYANEST